MTFQIRSPMSWGSWILIFVYPAQILGLALPGGLETLPKPLRSLNKIWDKVKAIAARLSKGISIVNIVLGAMLGIYTGILLSTFAARPLWNTSLLAPLFLISGLSTATALNMLSKPTHREKESLVRWDIGLLAIEFLFLIFIIISLLTGTEGHQSAAMLLLGGDYTASFWVLVVALGLAVPFWLEIRERVGRFVPSWTAPMLILIGGLALRMILVQAGQASHLPDTDLLSATLGY
jgi:formate-dependent nitrite reductase membrane component NrfD